MSYWNPRPGSFRWLPSTNLGEPEGSRVGWTGVGYEPGRSSASAFTIRSISRRISALNGQRATSSGRSGGGLWLRGSHPCLSSDEGAPAAVGLSPDVEGDLDVPRSVEGGKLIGSKLRRGLVVGHRLPRLGDRAKHDFVAGLFAQEHESGALDVVEG